jgi:hypothetical protein
MGKLIELFVTGACIILLAGCARKFTVTSAMKSFDFTVTEKLGKLGYVSPVDLRNKLDKKGQQPEACIFSSKRGTTVLGDRNYKNKLLPEFDQHLKKSLIESQLFTAILENDTSSTDYVFRSNLEQFNVVLDETKAIDAQVCVGGIIGSAIASGIDVHATTDLRITGIVTKGGREVWRQTVSKHVVQTDDYKNTEHNAEFTMGEAIGEGSKELVTALAAFLASQQ